MAQLFGYKTFQDAMSGGGDTLGGKIGSLFRGFGGERPFAPDRPEPTPSQPTSMAETQTAQQPAIQQTPQQPLQTEFRNPWVQEGTQSGGGYSNIFQPLTSGYQQASQQLGERLGEFQEATGLGQTFESLGGPEAFLKAIETGEYEPAQEILGRTYTGPESLNLGDITYDIGQLNQLARSLGTQSGVGTLLQESGIGQGLTPGELRYEAQNLLANPEFRQQAQQMGESIRNLTGAEAGLMGQAENLTEARRAEDEAIRTAAEEFLRGQEMTATAGLEKQLDAAEAERAKFQDLYDEFQETGDAGALLELEKLMSPEIYQQWQDYDTRRKEVESKYSGLADIPEMIYDEGQLGQPYRFEEEDWKDMVKKYGKEKAGEFKTQARERARALAALEKEKPEKASAWEALQKQRQTQQHWEQGQARYNAVMEHPNYAPIKDEPLLKVRKDVYHYLDKSGKWKVLKNHPDVRMRTLLLQRQKDLEKAGFGDIIHSQSHKAIKGKQVPHFIGGTETGKFADIMPIYYGEGAPGTWEAPEMPDLRRFATLTPGAAPTIANVAEAGDIERFNRIQELLGETGDIITPSEQPWTTGAYSSDVERWLEELAKPEREREAALDAAREAYFKNTWQTPTGGRFI